MDLPYLLITTVTAFGQFIKTLYELLDCFSLILDPLVKMCPLVNNVPFRHEMLIKLCHNHVEFYILSLTKAKDLNKCFASLTTV